LIRLNEEENYEMKLPNRKAGISLAVAALFALAACAGPATTTPAPGGAGETETASKGAIAMSFAGLDIAIWNDMLQIMEPQIVAAGYEFVTHDPQWDIQTQVNDWQNWIQRGDIKVIMGYPAQSDSMVAVTEQAQAAGIPVLGYASQWQGTSHSLLLDNYEDGRTLGLAAGKWIVEKYGTATAQPVAFLAYYDTDLGRERSEGILAGLEESGANVDITTHSVIGLTDGYDAAQAQLQAAPNTKIFIAIAGDPPQGAYQYVIDSGVSPDDPDYLFAALDATDEILDIFLSENSIWRIQYVLPAKSLADAMVQMMLAAAQGTLSADTKVLSSEVTLDNAESFYTYNQ
jgi:ABC-type sugar transport system substrate-binding protein